MSGIVAFSAGFNEWLGKMMKDEKMLWSECLEYLQDRLCPSDFATWICPLQAQQMGIALLLGAPNRIVLEELKSSYLEVIESFYKERHPDKITSVKLFILGDNPVQVESQGGVALHKREEVRNENSFLNPSFTFANFIIGKSNQLAEAAAEQVALSPGETYNPLFLYGGVGLGKTHLMHAVGNKIKETKPNLKVKYLHSEQFVADMVRAIQTNSLDDFKRVYRQIDVLLIDDIQFFSGKDRTQEEFFYLFNFLLGAGQQIILTSDRYPKDLGGIADRLKSRFGSGLTVAVDPPDLETRAAIVLKKAEAFGIPLSHDVAFYIAQQIRSNIRELEGALKRVIAHAKFLTRDISIDLAQRALKDIVAAQDRLMNQSNIIQLVADHYKIPIDQILASTRLKKYTLPRQIAISLCKELTTMSLPEIGRAFGGRDHSTILHACKKIEQLKENDYEIMQDYKKLLQQLTY